MTRTNDDEESNGVPKPVGKRGDDTGVFATNERIGAAEKIVDLYGRYSNLKENVPTKDELNRVVTGARKSIEAEAVEKYADAKMFAELKLKVEAHERKLEPKQREIPWFSIVALAITIGGFIWLAARYPERSEFKELGDKVQAIKEADIGRDTEVKLTRELARQVLDTLVGKVMRP